MEQVLIKEEPLNMCVYEKPHIEDEKEFDATNVSALNIKREDDNTPENEVKIEKTDAISNDVKEYAGHPCLMDIKIEPLDLGVEDSSTDENEKYGEENSQVGNYAQKHFEEPEVVLREGDGEVVLEPQGSGSAKKPKKSRNPKIRTERKKEYNLSVKSQKLIHQNMSFLTETGLNRCGFCNNTFEQQTVLFQHILTHKDEAKRFLTEFRKQLRKVKERRYFCDLCPKAFTQKHNLLQHKLIHTKEKPHTCSVCLKSFSQKCNLTMHLAVHSDEKPFECDHCSKTFTRKANLITHITIHSGKKPHRCNICSKDFNSMNGLRVHLLVHNEKKKYDCNVCNKSYKRKTHLKSHQLIHTGERPFPCNICPMAFNQKSNLKKHISRHWPDEYKCNICSKTFTQKQSFKAHLTIHTGKAKFRCHVCTKTFAVKNSLNRHLLIHTVDIDSLEKKTNTADLPKSEKANVESA